MASVVEILVYLTVIGLGWYFFLWRRKNYPPGPPRYPIIGNLFELGAEYNKVLFKHYQKYGPISSMKFGPQETVILHDLKHIKEAFNENVFSGRPPSPISEFLAGRDDGILQAEGRVWNDQRRFALRTLRDFGFGKKGMETMIMDEVHELMTWIGKQDGSPICLHRRINLAVVNALWTILTGTRYDHDDPKLIEVLEGIELVANELKKGHGMTLLLCGSFPNFAKSIPNWSGWNYLSGLAKVRQDMFKGIIDDHLKNRSDGHARDYIDVYISEVDKTTDISSSFHNTTAYSSLQSVMADLFLAGSDTTSTTLNWAILYLIHNQNILKKLQEELDRVVGNSRCPGLTDRNSLPYMEAFISETLRYSSIVPLGVGHRTLECVEFHGYRIPKGTVIFSNIWAVHHNPEIWGDPEVFRPERFLCKDGLTFQKNDNLIPFSVGKRTCLGFNLALDELFLLIACIVQRFNITAEPGKPKPTLEPKYGQITLQSHPYSVVMTERH